jgi:hypothetical protein
MDSVVLMGIESGLVQTCCRTCGVPSVQAIEASAISDVMKAFVPDIQQRTYIYTRLARVLAAGFHFRDSGFTLLKAPLDPVGATSWAPGSSLCP